jgi:L-amino acid N-acyltransferase YncA
MNPVRCDARYAPAILAILNDAIENSTALYDYRPRTLEMVEAWFETKAQGGYPILGIEDELGALLGFASFGPFRQWPANKYSVEHSIYVATSARGRGVGKALLRALIAAAETQGYHMMIGGIDASNVASIRLHVSLGFQHCASIKHAGFKFGRWLDLELYQLLLPTPAHPVDG